MCFMSKNNALFLSVTCYLTTRSLTRIMYFIWSINTHKLMIYFTIRIIFHGTICLYADLLQWNLMWHVAQQIPVWREENQGGNPNPKNEPMRSGLGVDIAIHKLSQFPYITFRPPRYLFTSSIRNCIPSTPLETS